MPYAVTLPLDDTAAARVELIWRRLEACTGAVSPLRLGYAPHVTLAVLGEVASASAIEAAVFQVVANWQALPLTLAALGMFPGVPPVLWAAPIVTSSLLAMQTSLVAALEPFEVDPHYRSGEWMPHVTLSKEGRASIAEAAEAMTAAWDGPIRSLLERVELIRFRPVKILAVGDFGLLERRRGC